MVFAANVFVFGFLPVFLAVYYLVPRAWRSGVIALFSYLFYGWWRPDFVLLLWLSTVVDFTAGRRIARGRERGEDPRAWLWLSVCVNLGLLGYFKYANWGIDTLDAMLLAYGAEPVEMARVILPVGISFYTFQTMSYTIDVYRGTARPVDRIVDFAAYVAMFPQLVAGPIVRYNSVAEQLREREHSATKFSHGALRFMIGFCKKVLIADSVAPLVDATFANPVPTFADAWLGTFAYTVQLYYDFSGYSDMAIGLGLMMGFVFPENFDHPYTARSITEFWRRWHISLSTWLRDYLYVPLGGNRKGPVRTYVNLMITMALGGIWHGANWTFVLWGLWHGALLAAERRFTRKQDGVRVAPRWPLPVTLLLVMLGWVVFRAPDVATALGFYRGMVGLNGLGLSDVVAWQVHGWAVLMLVVGLVLVWVAPAWRDFVGSRSEASRGRWANSYLVFVGLFVVAVSRLAAQSYTPFLYFQF